MVRRVLVLVVVVVAGGGCGRIAFDERARPSDAEPCMEGAGYSGGQAPGAFVISDIAGL